MNKILWLIIVLLVAGWIIGFLVFKILGGLIHLLLVIALALWVYNYILGRRKSDG